MVIILSEVFKTEKVLPSIVIPSIKILSPNEIFESIMLFIKASNFLFNSFSASIFDSYSAINLPLLHI